MLSELFWRIVVFMLKKQKNKAVSKKFLFVTLGIQTVIFAIAILGLFLFTSARTQNWNLPSTELVYMINSAISNLTREAPLTPENTYQYIPEAKLRFKTINNQKIVYAYNQEDPDSNIKASITISSDTIKRDSIAELYQYNQWGVPEGQQLFDRVPGVQNCNKLFVLSYDKDITSYHGEEYSLLSTLNTDGKNLYLWKHKGTLCNVANNVEVIEDLEQMLLSAETY